MTNIDMTAAISGIVSLLSLAATAFLQWKTNKSIQRLELSRSLRLELIKDLKDSYYTFSLNAEDFLSQLKKDEFDPSACEWHEEQWAELRKSFQKLMLDYETVLLTLQEIKKASTTSPKKAQDYFDYVSKIYLLATNTPLTSVQIPKACRNMQTYKTRGDDHVPPAFLTFDLSNRESYFIDSEKGWSDATHSNHRNVTPEERYVVMNILADYATQIKEEMSAEFVRTYNLAMKYL